MAWKGTVPGSGSALAALRCAAAVLVLMTATSPPASSGPPGKGGVDAVLDAARAAARSDRNALSVELFQQALRAAPERRDEILREYADQLVYAGRPAEAIPLFTEVLGSRGLPGQERRRAERALALALLWSGRFAEAVPAYDRVLSASPGDTDAAKDLVRALAGAARAMAQVDRNAESAALFDRAIRLAPRTRGELLREYADQLSFTRRAADAVPLYREVLSWPGTDPEQARDARRGLALALSWSGRPEEAQAEYEAVIRDFPADLPARLGRARVLAERGLRAEALAEYETALGLDPRHPEALKGRERVRAADDPPPTVPAPRPPAWASTTQAGAPGVWTWVTTTDAGRLLSPGPAVSVRTPDGSGAAPVLTIDDADLGQRIEGFGAALTESSAWLIQGLAPPRRDELMTRLFDPARGIGLSYLRQPMGSSEFALSHYSYDDLPRGEADPALARVSIDRERRYVIPLLRQARALNPQLRLMATPWTAPGWMKTSGSLLGGRLRADAYPAYAQYFVRVLEAFSAEGLAIDAVTVQNEPTTLPGDMPGMLMDTDEQAAFIGDHLGPALRAGGFKVRVLAWDDNLDRTDPARTLLNDPKAGRHLAGAAFHAYRGRPEAIAPLAADHPDRMFLISEGSSGTWETAFGTNLRHDIGRLIIPALRNGAAGVLKWNIALDPRHGPRTGGCSRCTGLVTIDPVTGGLQFNHDFFALGHFSKFIAPGARLVRSKTAGAATLQTVAALNPDGSLAVVLYNPERAEAAVDIRWRGLSAGVPVPAEAVMTLVWRRAAGAT
ncbi:MAG TPA: tetratricopeptide repeat protein [Azospirillaceae bacterium]|nr:tetratricopeptide repeat protein [Azospirillaceae bacterium]